MTRRLILSIGVLALAGAAVAAQDQAPNRRDFTIVARDHQFTPDRIEVTKDDLVRITLTSEGRPYSFAIDAYRILKRVGAGQTIVFDFRADQAGTFTFYCNLTSDRVPRHEGNAGGRAKCSQFQFSSVQGQFRTVDRPLNWTDTELTDHFRELVRVVREQPIDAEV